MGPAQLQQGIVKVHADLLRALDPAFWYAGTFHSHPTNQRLLVGNQAGFSAVDGRRDQEAHPELPRSMHIIFPIMHAVGSSEDVLLGHEDTGAAGGDADSCGERVIQQEVVTFDVKAPISTVDLPLHSPRLQSPWRRGGIKVTHVTIVLLIVLHVHCGESAETVGVESLEGQFVGELLPRLLLISSVEAAGVAAGREVQLSLRAEAGAAEGRRGVGDQRGPVHRRVEEGRGERQEVMHEQEQVREKGDDTRRHHG